MSATSKLYLIVFHVECSESFDDNVLGVLKGSTFLLEVSEFSLVAICNEG